jgi:hypothetical protein
MKRVFCSLVLSLAVAVGVTVVTPASANVTMAGPNWCC